jgi:hypothetical protein
MLNVTAVLGWRGRSAILLALFSAGALQSQAAVLPLASDPLAEPPLTRAGLLTAPMAAVSGQWVGRTSAGKVVSLTLLVERGEVVGAATLDGVVADAKPGPRRLVTPIVTGRMIAFSVDSGSCDNAMAHGIVKFVSAGSAELNLLAGRTPIVVQLSKIG